MSEADFWDLIARHVDIDGASSVDTRRLQRALEALSPDEIISFDDIFTTLYCASYAWPLRGAAHLLHGGCSDDGFDYFRGWLIAQGRRVFERAVRDPDSLVDHGRADVESAEMLSVASRAYEAATGGDMPYRPCHYPKLGEGWDLDDRVEMKRRYPRLFARYGAR